MFCIYDDPDESIFFDSGIENTFEELNSPIHIELYANLKSLGWIFDIAALRLVFCVKFISYMCK